MWGWGLSEHVCPGQAWQQQARFSALRGAAPGLVEGSRFPRPGPRASFPRLSFDMLLRSII